MRKVHGNTAPAFTAPLWGFTPILNPTPPSGASGITAGGHRPALLPLGPLGPFWDPLAHFGISGIQSGQPLENPARKILPRWPP